jgi:hypothetical protein
MLLRKASLALLLLILLATSGLAADLNYPYGSINLRLPPAENPYPGFGSNFSTISKGMQTALWNPASLGKVKLSQASLSLMSTPGTNTLTKTSKLNEISGTLEVGAGGSSSSKSVASYALFFRPLSDLIGVGTTTKEISVRSNMSYATSGTGQNFSAAQRVNDWLVVGFASRNPLDADISLAGDFPLTGRTDMNLYGQNFGGFKITSSGSFEFNFGNTTLTTEAPAWSGFLSQEVTIPFTNISEFRDNINVESPYVGTIAAQYGKFYAGMNMLPISASGQIDNDVRTVVNANTPDQAIYVPSFDPNDPVGSVGWFTDPTKYGAQGGYLAKPINLPTGDIVADARYRGFYSGSTARLDLGMMYDVSDWFTVGLVMENISGSVLTMNGNGLAGYATYRNVNTQETNSLLQPGDGTGWTVFQNQWTTTDEVNGTPLALEQTKTFQLPKKMRLGFALKRPFLIAVDYEINQSPFTIPASQEITVSNISFIRIGMESQLFSLPFWFRSGTTLALKPSIASTDQKTVDNINKAFKYGVLPVKLDFGSTVNLWGWEIGDSLGLSLMPVLSVLQFDATNVDLSKMAYYSLSVMKGPWEVKYLTQVDPGSTAAAFSEEPSDSSGNKNFSVSDIRYVQTIGATYTF